MCLGILDAWLGIFQIGISAAFIAEILPERGYLKLLLEPMPMLTRGHMQKRLDWRCKYRNFDWNKVVFTDGETFKCFDQK